MFFAGLQSGQRCGCALGSWLVGRMSHPGCALGAAPFGFASASGQRRNAISYPQERPPAAQLLRGDRSHCLLRQRRYVVMDASSSGQEPTPRSASPTRRPSSGKEGSKTFETRHSSHHGSALSRSNLFEREDAGKPGSHPYLARPPPPLCMEPPPQVPVPVLLADPRRLSVHAYPQMGCGVIVADHFLRGLSLL